MKFEGVYKAEKVVKNVEGKGFVFFDLAQLLAETTDAAEKHMLEKTAGTLLMVDKEAHIKQAMAIPEGTPAEEIEKAKSRGMEVSDDGKYIVTKSEVGKYEGDALYLYDKTTFLAGTEWVKISTDTEGELNLITTLYRKIQ